MTKLLNLIIVVLALALVAVIVYPQIQANRPRLIRFACDSTASSLPILVGIEESLFVNNRITPELVWYSDPDQALADLFAGKSDVGIFPWSTVLKRITSSGESLKVFMSQEFRQTLPVDAIVVPAKSKLRVLTDLRKKKLGYPPQLRDYVRPLLTNINIQPQDITAIEVPLSTLVEQLVTGSIDAAWLLEPVLCALDTVAFRTLQPGVLARYVSAPFPGAAVGFTPGFYAKSDKVLLSRLKIATDAAVALTEGNVDKAKMVLGKYFPYCKEFCQTCRLPEMQRLVEINRPAVAALSARLAASGVLSSEVETQNLFVEPARLTR